MKKKKAKKSLAYIPEDAGLNYTSESSSPPRTDYERRRKAFKRAEVKDLTKGKYGQDK